VTALLEDVVTVLLEYYSVVSWLHIAPFPDYITYSCHRYVVPFTFNPVAVSFAASALFLLKISHPIGLIRLKGIAKYFHSHELLVLLFPSVLLFPTELFKQGN